MVGPGACLTAGASSRGGSRGRCRRAAEPVCGRTVLDASPRSGECGYDDPTHRGSSLLRLSAIVLLTAGAVRPGCPECAFGGDLVRAQTQDGRVFTGEVDAETDENLLWLRLTAPSIVVKTPIRWNIIVRVSHADRQLSAAEFRPVAETLKSEVPADIFAQKAADRAATPRIESNRGQTARPRRVQSIRIEAVAANWDADVEIDGLEVRVIPLTADGAVLPVEGVLSVQLIGSSHVKYGQTFPEIGRWNRRVRIADYDDFRGALYRLPFQAVNPEFDLEFGWYGIVHARLGVSGHGSFDASAQVRVRTGSGLRDQLQLLNRRRFFPSEWTSR